MTNTVLDLGIDYDGLFLKSLLDQTWINLSDLRKWPVFNFFYFYFLKAMKTVGVKAKKK